MEGIMAFDDGFTGRTLPDAFTRRSLSDNQLRTLSQIKLNTQETLNDSLRLPLVKSYEDHLNWVYRRALAIGYNNNVSFDCVKGFYVRFLTKFVTPYLTGQVYFRARNAAVINTDQGAVDFYKSKVDTSHGRLYTHRMPHLPNTEKYETDENKKYITGARVLMLRDSFMIFMRTLKERLTLKSNDLGTAGLVSGGARINRLSKITFTGSDPHHGMQVVLILHYGNNKVVYKPRDTRVDELIVGRGHNVGTHPCAGSLGELLNANGIGTGAGIPDGVPGYFLPNYRFLSCGEYGFVQFLNLDLSHSQQKHYNRYAWLCGTYATMGMIFGLTDLHQGNMMLCSRKRTKKLLGVHYTRHCLPHLTDLELAFSNDVLGQDNWVKAFGSTGFSSAMRATKEIDYMDKFAFTQDRRSNKLIRVITGVQKESLTDNLPRSGSRPIHFATRPTFKQNFKNGLIKAFRVLRGLPNETLDGFMDRFDGCRARFHAQATRDQLDKIREFAWIGLEGRKAVVKEGRGGFIPSMLADWNRFDVAYYVKHLGGITSGRVDHIAQGHAVTPIDGGARATGGNTYAKVRVQLKHLPNDEDLEKIAEAIATDVTKPIT
jgi:hypothetical protein